MHMESDHVNNQLQGSSSASSSKITINESDPAEYLKMKPKKSILKSKQTSFEDLQKSVEQVISRELDDGQKEAHFDEMNILATHHPPNKDYGHMKIDEPKTPYNAYSDSEEDSQAANTRPRRVSLVGPVDAEKLMKGLSKAPLSKPKCYEPGSGPEEDDDESGLTPDQIVRKREFEKKRRAHYDEGAMLRKMREKANKPDDSQDD